MQWQAKANVEVQNYVFIISASAFLLTELGLCFYTESNACKFSNSAGVLPVAQTQSAVLNSAQISAGRVCF